MSALYDAAREAFLTGRMNWLSDDVRVMLVRDTYEFDAAHHLLSDVGMAENGRSASLKHKTSAVGVAGADGTSIEFKHAVECNALILFNHETARLVAYVDEVRGLPAKLGAGSVLEVQWSSGPDKIFRL